MLPVCSPSIGAAGPGAGSVEQRVAALDWSRILAELDARGFAVVPGLLTADECVGLAALYDEPTRFRSRVVMARHGFGRGEYRYFEHPLPDLITALRAASYPRLVPVADAWSQRLRQPRRHPATLDALHDECRAVGQLRPTPLLLKYGPDDYNCLHQDLYGDVVFPLQLAGSRSSVLACSRASRSCRSRAGTR
jgi:hypothetical protein